MDKKQEINLNKIVAIHAMNVFSEILGGIRGGQRYLPTMPGSIGNNNLQDWKP